MPHHVQRPILHRFPEFGIRQQPGPFNGNELSRFQRPLEERPSPRMRRLFKQHDSARRSQRLRYAVKTGADARPLLQTPLLLDIPAAFKG